MSEEKQVNAVLWIELAAVVQAIGAAGVGRKLTDDLVRHMTADLIARLADLCARGLFPPSVPIRAARVKQCPQDPCSLEVVMPVLLQLFVEDDNADCQRFTHDCDGCEFLGHGLGHDHFYCEQIGLPTLVSRFGNGPSEYLSGMQVAAEVAERDEPLGLAFALWTDRRCG